MKFEKFIPKDWHYHSSAARSKKVLIKADDLPLHLRHCLCVVNVLTKLPWERKSISIYRIENPQKYLQYQLKKLEMQSSSMDVGDKLLYHVTGESDFTSICNTNLDFRQVNRERYGAGVSFSPDVVYGHTCSFKSDDPTVILVCKVLYSVCELGSDCQLVPKVGCDTTLSEDGMVFVKYEDSSFVPIYAFLIH